MAQNKHGQAEYEFWRWEYQRRNCGYRKALDAFVDSVNARVALGFDHIRSIIESEMHNKELERVLISPFVCFDWYLSSTLFPFLVPAELLEFIKMEKRLPDHYSNGRSSKELLESIDVETIPRQFPPHLFHVPSFYINFTFPDKFVEDIELTVPISASIEILQLELSFIHAVCTTTWINPDELPEVADSFDEDECDDEASPAQPDPRASALGALRAWWRKKDKTRARYASLPRAVGLWLYDYCELEGASATKAVEAFLEKYLDDTGSCRFGRQFDDDHLLMKLLSTTRKCVETIEVLPIRRSRALKVAP